FFGSQHGQLTHNFVRELVVIPSQRSRLGLRHLRRPQFQSHAGVVVSRLQFTTPGVSSAYRPQAVTGHQSVLTSLVDEDELFFTKVHMGVQACQNARLQVNIRGFRRNHVKATTYRTHSETTLNDVHGLNQRRASDAVLSIPTIYSHRPIDLHNLARRFARIGYVRSTCNLLEHGQPLPNSKVDALLHQQIDDASIREQHVVFMRSSDLSPNVPLRVANVTLIANEDRSALDGRRPSHKTPSPGRVVSPPLDLLFSGSAHLVARIDPVRVFDLRIEAPHLRPSPGISVVSVR